MEKRFFLYRIDVLADGAAIYQRDQGAVPVLTNLADAVLTGLDHAVMAAQVAADPVFTHFLVQQCFFHINSIQQVGCGCQGLIVDAEMTNIAPTRQSTPNGIIKKIGMLKI